jgi:uncharacterized damage-inducible protein DinB
MRAQLKFGHDTLTQAVADLTADHLHARAEGSTIQSIAAIYAHITVVEDELVNSIAREQPTLFEQGNWSEKVGFDADAVARIAESSSEAVRGMDLTALRDFAQQVYAHTDDYIGSLSEVDLDRTVTGGPLGEAPLGVFLADFVACHVALHAGEICALKGTLSMKGFPF